MLKSKLTIKNIELSNRLVMPPMATSKANSDGTVTDELVSYYDEKTKGGYIGLVITEHTYVSLEGQVAPFQMSISKDEDIEGLKKIVDVIHRNGSKVICQINHGGAATGKPITGYDSVSSSPTDYYLDRSHQRSRALTKDEIKELVVKFGKAALRAKIAGFDGVEIHAAHAYLLNQFYSPIINKREDEYGPKCMENRLRFIVEVIREVRKNVGNDYLVAIRLGGCDYMDGGSTIEDAVEACKTFEKESVDLLDISGGLCRYMRKELDIPGYFKDMTFAIKKEVNIPVILTGGIKSKEDAESLLKEGASDLIGVGRPILADSLWAKRNME